jgi:hypothetical protein
LSTNELTRSHKYIKLLQHYDTLQPIYRNLEENLSNANILMVVPYVDKQISSISKILKDWNKEQTSPCNISKGAYYTSKYIDLAFYNNRINKVEIVEQIMNEIGYAR